MRCAIWYHLHNLKNVKNTHGGVLILVKLQAKAFTKIYFILPLTLILFRVPLTYKQWNLHIYIHKQLLGLSVSTLCKSRIFFSAGVSNALFFILRSFGNILPIEEYQKLETYRQHPICRLMGPNQVELILKSHLNISAN